MPGVTLMRGQASFLDGHRPHVAGQNQEVRAGHIVLATGSVLASLPIPGFEHTWNDRDLFACQDSQQELSADLAILEAGYIGIEAACMLTDLGHRVTVLEKENRILPAMDPELAGALHQAMDGRFPIRTGSRWRRSSPGRREGSRSPAAPRTARRSGWPPAG